MNSQYVENQSGAILIGPGTQLNGEVTSARKLIVSGTFRGKINVGHLEVTPQGRVVGEVFVEFADIAGYVSDSIVSSGLVILRSSSRIEGTLSYKELELERGAVVLANLQRKDPDAKAKSVAVSASSAAETVLVKLRALQFDSENDAVNAISSLVSGQKNFLQMMQECKDSQLKEKDGDLGWCNPADYGIDQKLINNSVVGRIWAKPVMIEGKWMVLYIAGINSL